MPVLLFLQEQHPHQNQFLTQKIKYDRYLHIKNIYKINKKDNILLTSPVDNSLGQRILFLATLTGCNLIYLKKYNRKNLKNSSKMSVFLFQFFHLIIYILMKNDLLSKNIRIKKIVSAASTLSLKDKRDFKKNSIKLFEMYGAAEIGTITNLDTSNLKKQHSVGKILKL